MCRRNMCVASMCVEHSFGWFRGPTAEHQAFGGFGLAFLYLAFRLSRPGTTSRSTAHSSGFLRAGFLPSDWGKLLSIQGWCCVARGWRGAASRHWWWALITTMRAHETCYQLINNLSIYLYINCHVSFLNIIYFEVLSSSFWIMPSSMLVTSPGWRQIETDDTCAPRIKFMKLRLKHESWGAAGRRCVASWGHWSIQNHIKLSNHYKSMMFTMLWYATQGGRRHPGAISSQTHSCQFLKVPWRLMSWVLSIDLKLFWFGAH